MYNFFYFSYLYSKNHIKYILINGRVKEDNLFIAGELLDINGDCGGYNLSVAWISGMLAGRAAGENNY